ncbi:hypothetical protein AMR72_02505 [Flavobacterium psychrophilum]|nr:hypothetical protein AMR72_02505 [Flavobacterium psychrophilum]AOE51489.1 hypothetical protein ALW18_02505 [Flavobacterium psychrophilum]
MDASFMDDNNTNAELLEKKILAGIMKLKDEQLTENVILFYDTLYNSLRELTPIDFRDENKFNKYRNYLVYVESELASVHHSVINLDQNYIDNDFLLIRVALSSMLAAFQ